MGRQKNLLGGWKALLSLLTLCMLQTSAWAIEQKGVAEASVGMRLDSKEKQSIIEDALRNAVETWVAEKQQSHYRNYEKVKSQIDSNINDYVLRHQIVDENKDKRLYRVVLRADLNEPKLLDTLLQPSAQAVSGEQQYLTFIFVAREKVGTERASEREANQVKTQTQEISKQRGESGAAQTKSQNQSIAGRKVERNFKDRTLWDVTTSNEIDVAMGEIFTEARYLVVDAALLEEETGHLLSIERFVEDYGLGNDVQPATRREALKGLSALRDSPEPIHYLAIGTLDVGDLHKDPKTDNYRIAVSVTGQVLAIFRRGAAVAKVGPEVMQGEGPSELVAKNNALKSAAQQVASQLVAKLSAQNIR